MVLEACPAGIPGVILPKINLAEIDENITTGSSVPVPEGFYDAEISSAIFVPGDKQHMLISFKIIEGDYAGSYVKNWFYTHMPDPKRITLEQLSAVGVKPTFNPANASTLTGKVCRIATKLSDDGKYAVLHRLYQRLIDAGSYECMVSSVERDSRNDKPFLRVAYTISGGEFDGLRLTENLYLNDKSMKFTGARLKRIGATHSEFDTDNNSHIRSLIGNRVLVTTMPVSLDNGRSMNRVTSVSQSEGPVSEEIVVDMSSVAGAKDPFSGPSEFEDFDDDFEDDDKF